MRTPNFPTGRRTQRNLRPPINYVLSGSRRKSVSPAPGLSTDQGSNPSKKIIALRADLDALPIQEANDISYKSQNPGVMHACGHDVHTSSLLGTAKILSQLNRQFEGTVKLILPARGGKEPRGERPLMIREGVLENPAPAAIIGNM